MAWEEQGIERRMDKALRADLGDAKAAALKARYVTARTKLIEEVVLEIKGTEPSLTDHGERHLANVLYNAEKLIYGASSSRLRKKSVQDRQRSRVLI